MNTIERIFNVFAISCVFFAIGLYLLPAGDYLRDKGIPFMFHKAVTGFACLCLFLGLGGAALYGPLELIRNKRSRASKIEAMKLVKAIAEINRMDEYRRDVYWKKNRSIYRTTLPYDLWKYKALEEYGVDYDEIFPRGF